LCHFDIEEKVNGESMAPGESITVEQEMALLEVRYGVPWEQIPEILRMLDPPEHPQGRIHRRGNYISGPSFSRHNGWRLLRDGIPGYYGFGFKYDVERRQRALVEARRLRSKRKGRGKPAGRRPELPDWRRDEES